MNTVHIFCLKGNKLRQVYTTDINNTCLHTVDRKSKAKVQATVQLLHFSCHRDNNWLTVIITVWSH